MNEQRLQQCARPHCLCEVAPGQTYCGPHCANASNEIPDVETRCGCGHAPCGAERAISPSGETSLTDPAVSD